MPAGVTGGNTINIGASSNLENVDLATLPRPGELGQRVYGSTNKEYQVVQLDSGATAANTVGVAARGQVSYWKDKVNYIVTNDLRQSPEGRNGGAGIFMKANTAGYYTLIQQRGNMSAVVDGATTPAVGDIAIPNSGTNADITKVSAGTAPTYNVVGTYASTQSGGKSSIDLNFPQVP